MKVDLIDVLYPPISALIALGIVWANQRVLREGKPLTRGLKLINVFAFSFIMGMGYIILFLIRSNASLDWLYLLLPLWGGLIGCLIWIRFKKRAGAQDGYSSDSS